MNLKWSPAKRVALGSAYMLYMDQNVGSRVPDSVSRQASYGEYVCWITPFDSPTVVAQWLSVGYGDPEWLWRHEALAFGGRYLAHPLQRAQAM